MYRIITVCTGNICRSPMAQVILRQKLADAGLADQVEVTSAATTREEIGNPIDPRASRVLRDKGLDPEHHAAHQLTADEARAADLLIAMDHPHLRPIQRWHGGADLDAAGRTGPVRMIRSFDPDVEGDDLGIRDPWYGGAEDFERTWDLLQPALDGVVRYVRDELHCRNEAQRSSEEDAEPGQIA